MGTTEFEKIRVDLYLKALKFLNMKNDGTGNENATAARHYDKFMADNMLDEGVLLICREVETQKGKKFGFNDLKFLTIVKELKLKPTYEKQA